MHAPKPRHGPLLLPSLAILLCVVAAGPPAHDPPARPRPPAVDPVSGKMLFVDKEVVAESDAGIVLEVHPPQKLGAVITRCAVFL